MAVPKKKMSRMRTRQRKAQWKIERPNMSTCPRCKSPKLQHRACRECGTYNGREVVETD
ncbi:MAG: 50S ribosomal protein L32 [Acidimicrobiia bacterium]|nr:50S ribosomal protein L32 [Acidimicrobiia bacterium]MDH4309206.1 50S ribosomal protein L32 [Acidimicrobiia bacterium]MDH5292466.1 50S ribosomal protein L32 [Acidimicrobiia bacterium]